jgi:electron transport complex protein RnfB
MRNKRMEADVYRRLAEHLDDLPAGFPATKSGVELRILKRLFTEEEAELAILLSFIPEGPESVAVRARLPIAEAARRLEEMSRKGLIYRHPDKGGGFRYSANHYVIGVWEYQVNRLEPGLVRDMDEYMDTLLFEGSWKKTPQLRVVPVGKSIPVRREILAHELAEELVGTQDRFLVAPCICRRERTMMGEGCGKLEEACLIMGAGVDYYEQNGMGEGGACPPAQQRKKNRQHLHVLRMLLRRPADDQEAPAAGRVRLLPVPRFA